MRAIVLQMARRSWGIARVAALAARSRLHRSPHRPLAWEADILDDVAFNRPWNIVIKFLRLIARARKHNLRPGTTIVIVNWNTLAVTRETLFAVQALTASDVEIIVVDNRSTDGSREWLREQSGIRSVLLPTNAGHAVALDIAALLTRTSVLVTLDSDAVPLRAGWLDSALHPLAAPGILLAGLRSSRDFVHPVFSALDVVAFIDRRLSFQVFREPGVAPDEVIWGVNSWDTGELMTARLGSDEVAMVPATPNLVEGLPGMTTGGVVYHHGGVTRAAEVDAPPDDSYQRWREALESLLPPEALRPADVG